MIEEARRRLRDVDAVARSRAARSYYCPTVRLLRHSLHNTLPAPEWSEDEALTEALFRVNYSSACNLAVISRD